MRRLLRAGGGVHGRDAASATIVSLGPSRLDDVLHDLRRVAQACGVEGDGRARRSRAARAPATCDGRRAFAARHVRAWRRGVARPADARRPLGPRRDRGGRRCAGGRARRRAVALRDLGRHRGAASRHPGGGAVRIRSSARRARGRRSTPTACARWRRARSWSTATPTSRGRGRGWWMRWSFWPSCSLSRQAQA